MKYFYELITSNHGLPIKIYIHSADKFAMHLHSEIEIVFVLKGSINISIGNKNHLLKENDIMIVNSNEVHSTSRTDEKNMILILQIDSSYYSRYYEDIKKVRFCCSSFGDMNEEENLDIIREYLAKIVWENNKKDKGYKLILESETSKILSFLLNNFNCYFVEEEEVQSIKNDMSRIENIITYIDNNFQKKITLQDVADNEYLSVYHTSRFITKTLGLSFQEYLNYKRLDKFIDLLGSTDKTITEISYESGFPSPKSLNRLFKIEYNCSPSEYMKNKANKELTYEKVEEKTYLDIDKRAAYRKLFSYLKPLKTTDTKRSFYNTEKSRISIDSRKIGNSYKKHWKKLTTFSKASDGLKIDWQEQFKEMQREISFEYVRFHGIFSDCMIITSLDSFGNIIYNWSYVNKLLDFFKENNIKPFIELGYMPSHLKSSDETIFLWKGNISQPKEMIQWENLINEFVGNAIKRYGLKEVETWYFEVWNEPNLENVFWIGSKEQYFNFYKETVSSIRSVLSKAKIGGPAITYQSRDNKDWLEAFLQYCKNENIYLDFISLHIYSDDFMSKLKAQEEAIINKDKKIKIKENKKINKNYFDENNTSDTLKLAKEQINMNLDYKPELHITEWNVSSTSGNPINDTMFIATFITKNIIDSIGLTDSLGYWSFTDIMEEFKVKDLPFHGGFGLFNRDGIKKASYLAYYLLSLLGDKILYIEDEYIVTKQDDDIQILIYNFVYFDELFLTGDTSAITNKERYNIYKKRNNKEIDILIDGLDGKYKFTKYSLNRENGSVFDEWIKMNLTENLYSEEIDYLKRKAFPKTTIEYKNIEKQHTEKVLIPVHGIELITIKKQL